MSLRLIIREVNVIGNILRTMSPFILQFIIQGKLVIVAHNERHTCELIFLYNTCRLLLDPIEARIAFIL